MFIMQFYSEHFIIYQKKIIVKNGPVGDPRTGPLNHGSNPEFLDRFLKNPEFQGY